MQSVNQPIVEHEVMHAGVDWITATAKHGNTRWDMTEFARHERERLMDSGTPIKSAYRLGYDGFQSEGFFYGQREGGTIIIASGSVAHSVHRSVVNVADHISRLDLQVTVSTPIDRPHLAVQAYSALKSGSPARIHIKNVALIQNHPQGETCNVGKRKSDTYGRIYDKASESSSGPARSLWRYEVEFKRNPAHALASRISDDHPPETMAQAVVFDWFNARGVVPLFNRIPFSCPQEPPPSPPKHDVLRWFEESLSVTVARAVKRYGYVRVLEALGLPELVNLIRKGGAEHGARN